MKYLMYALCLYFASVALAMGKEVNLSPEALRQDNWQVTYRLPCNWDTDAAGVTVLAYYGTNAEVDANMPLYQVDIQPDYKDRFGPAIMLDLPSSVSEPVGGRPLHHVGIDYRNTKKACPADFGGSMLVK